MAERGVTRREAEVLAALTERLTNAELAARLYLSERTVESHVSSLLRKLGVGNRHGLSDVAKEVLGGTAAAALPSGLELLADARTFVGRHAELVLLRELWVRASAGRTLVAVVAGEAGIGKSRLVAEVAAEIHGSGGRVLLGPCFEDGSSPYEPFVHAITDDVSGLPFPEARRRVGDAAEALARVVPELPPVLDVEVPLEVLDPTAAQIEVFAGVLGYFTRAAEGGPMLLVVEDVHWARPTTLGAIRHIAGANARAPMLILVTTRDAPPDLDDRLAVFLADLTRLPSVERIDLTGLPEADIAALLRDLGDDTDPGTVLAETHGNPLFVRERASGTPGQSGGSLMGLIARRYALLTEEDRDVVDIGAVLGSEFDAM